MRSLLLNNELKCFDERIGLPRPGTRFEAKTPLFSNTLEDLIESAMCCDLSWIRCLYFSHWHSPQTEVQLHPALVSYFQPVQANLALVRCSEG